MKNDRIKQLDMKLDNSAAAADDMDLLNDEVKKLKFKFASAESQLNDKDRELKAKYIQLKDMHKDNKTTNDKLTKLQSIHLPRLTKAMQNVGQVNSELKLINEDSALLPEMFKKERKTNIQYQTIMQDAIDERDKAVSARAGLMRTKEDLTIEVSRKVRLAMVTQAARDGM